MIRRAKIQDANVIARIHVDAWRKAYRGILPEAFLEEIDLNERTDQWIRILEGSESATYVYEREAFVRAWISIGRNRDDDRMGFAEIWALYVSPEDWGQGLGKALMLFAEETAVATRTTDLLLWVLEQNLAARAFYTRMGYHPEGARKVIQMGSKALKKMRYHKQLNLEVS